MQEVNQFFCPFSFFQPDFTFCPFVEICDAPSQVKVSHISVNVFTYYYQCDRIFVNFATLAELESDVYLMFGKF